jgi:hypothetical protein
MMVKLLENHLNSVISEANKRLRTFKSVVEYSTLSTKLKSELISNMLEASFAKVVPDVISPFSDNEPDLWVMGNPLEIKTAKTTYVWRGGEFSKRESDYLMVSYDDSGDEMKWFFLHTYLLESDWKSSGSGNYYATTIDLNDILKKDYRILVGDVKKKKIKTHLICE